MNIFFWQIRISPHQSSFLRNLALKNNVHLIVDNNLLSSERRNLGWIMPDLGNVNVIQSPSKKEIRSIIRSGKDNIHVFSSYYHSQRNFYALVLAVRNKNKIGLLAEPYGWFGIKGKIRHIRERAFYKLFGPRISFFLTIGSMGLKLYSKAGYSKQKLFDWGYFIEEFFLESNSKINEEKKFIITYIGRLVSGKGLENLIKAISNISEDFNLKIVGDGPIKDHLKHVIERENLTDKISFLGIIENNKIPELLQSADLLVLPSDKKDGWGAVINEALTAGVQVICSNNCGASSLLKEYWRGTVFEHNNIKLLEQIIRERIQHGKLSMDTRLKIQKWAKQNISGKAASIYLYNILRFIHDKSNIRPLPPWYN